VQRKALFTPTLHHATPPAEDAVCAKSFSEPPTKNQGSGATGSGCLNFVAGGGILGQIGNNPRILVSGAELFGMMAACNVLEAWRSP